MEISGKVLVIGETEEVGSNGFTKRLIVIETKEQYPQKIGIDFVKDKTSLLDSFTVGQDAKVSVNLRGNEYRGKYYVNLQGWRIENLDQDSAPEQPKNDSKEEEKDDVPF